MIYSIEWPRCPGMYRRPSRLASRDEIVTASTEAFSWAVGLSLMRVLSWAERRGCRWRLVGEGTTL